MSDEKYSIRRVLQPWIQYREDQQGFIDHYPNLFQIGAFSSSKIPRSAKAADHR